MRIAVVTEEFSPGFGAVRDEVHHFAREARRLGHVVKVLTGGVRDAPGPGDDDVIRIGASRRVLRGGVVTRATGGTGAGAALRDVLARERFDVVHVHSPLTPVLPLLALHHATGPVVGTFHPHATPGLVLRLARRMAQRYLDRLDAAVAASRACLGRLEGSLRGEVRVVPGGVDAERFARGRRLPRFEEDGKLNVLWIGRAERRNGLGPMLSAFHRAWRQIDARLLVVGDGPGLARARASLPPDLADDVVFAGRVDDERPDWYATADVVCATAQGPSAGATILEGMAAGKPVLASDVPGYRDVLQHGREGELVAPGDEGAWARALVRLSREPVRAAAYGERGRLTAQRHAWPVVTRELLGIFRSVGALG